MYKLLDRHIEWIVALGVVYISTLGMFRALMSTLHATSIIRLLLYSSILIVGLLFWYQKRHFGVKIYDKFFFYFYLFYCLYVFLDMTVFRRYPLEDMLVVPSSLSLYFYNFIISLGYLACAPTIFHKFNLRKYVFLSLLMCTIPSVLFVRYVGVDIIQAGVGENDEEYISTLTVTFSNVPMLVIAVMNFKTLYIKKWLSIIIATIIIASVLYVLFAFGKRGPMLWSVVNIMVCFFITSVNLRKYIFVLGLVVISFIALLDPIIEGISEVLPRTGQRMEMSLKEGETDGRFDLDDPKHSTYLIGLENFSRSPIWGYYFRLVTDYQQFKGAYSHNIFIEVLMTMGLIGFIPFMILLIKAYNKSRKIFTKPYTANQMAFFILFLCAFLQLQTSATLLFRHYFWLFFYMLCCFDELPLTSSKRLQQNQIHYN